MVATSKIEDAGKVGCKAKAEKLLFDFHKFCK
jgi:hypothetical protein